MSWGYASFARGLARQRLARHLLEALGDHYEDCQVRQRPNDPSAECFCVERSEEHADQLRADEQRDRR